ncbi:MAG TPA: sterol desaturase family protein [Aliidongia sp.]|nr:sterol desaturase family protein [Aliidongia sp.]
MTGLYGYFLPLISALIVFALTVLVARILERKWPIATTPAAEYVADIKLSLLAIFLNRLLGPLTAISAALIINLAGGGLIELRSDGWWFPVSLVTTILTLDFVSYWVHRAQHAVPALWAMHSLHHSAEAMTMVTGARHFWLESLIQLGLLPFLPVLFKVPTIFIMVVPLIYFLPDGCSHINVRLSLGRFGLLLNNPQYHRIHHSVLPEHRDKNFCRLLPLFDVLFGTAWQPAADEFPATGLMPSEKPSGFWDGFFWPVRNQIPFRRISGLIALMQDLVGKTTDACGMHDATPAPRILGGGERAYRTMEPASNEGDVPS